MNNINIIKQSLKKENESTGKFVFRKNSLENKIIEQVSNL